VTIETNMAARQKIETEKEYKTEIETHKYFFLNYVFYSIPFFDDFEFTIREFKIRYLLR